MRFRNYAATAMAALLLGTGCVTKIAKQPVSTPVPERSAASTPSPAYTQNAMCGPLSGREVIDRHSVANYLPDFQIEQGYECDFNGDRKQDIAVIASGLDTRGLYIFLKTDNGYLKLDVDDPEPMREISLSVEDLTSDGLPELISEELKDRTYSQKIKHIRVLQFSENSSRMIADISHDATGESYILNTDEGRKILVKGAVAFDRLHNINLGYRDTPQGTLYMAFRWDGNEFVADPDFNRELAVKKENVRTIANQPDSETAQRDLAAYFNTLDESLQNILKNLASEDVGMKYVPTSVNEWAAAFVVSFAQHYAQESVRQRGAELRKAGVTDPQLNTTDNTYEVTINENNPSRQTSSFKTLEDAQEYTNNELVKAREKQMQKSCAQAAQTQEQAPKGPLDVVFGGAGEMVKQAICSQK